MAARVGTLDEERRAVLAAGAVAAPLPERTPAELTQEMKHILQVGISGVSIRTKTEKGDKDTREETLRKKDEI